MLELTLNIRPQLCAGHTKAVISTDHYINRAFSSEDTHVGSLCGRDHEHEDYWGG
jgi:hypothetical protein